MEKNKKKVYEYLFKEGVLVAKKDVWAAKHGDIDVPNLHVMKLLQGLKSKGFVKEDFNWQYFYWFLTNEGIEYLRKYLSFPEEVVPATLKKPRTATRPSGSDRDRPPPRGDRPQGRGRPQQDGDKKVGAPSGDFKPDFRGTGIGRGAPRERREGGRDSYRRDGGSSTAPSGPGFGSGRGAQQK